MDNPKTIDEAVAEILARVDSEGAASITVKDGHIVALSLEKLKALVYDVETADRTFCVIFLQNPRSLN